MPFANLGMPSIALTQLKSVLDKRFGERVSVGTHYLNLEFARYLGIDFYDELTNSADSQNSGLGDWFFRQTAFPASPNNVGDYFARYIPQQTENANRLKRALLESRRRLEGFLDELITLHGLDQADIVGFTSMFMQNVASFAMARMLKARKPGVVTLMGGANCESPMGQVIAKNVEQIDYVFSGPGLKSLPDFVQHHLDGEPWKAGSVRGVLTRKNYAIRAGADTVGEELSIDTPVELDYEPFLSALEKKGFDGRVKPVLLFETSRGCWWGERAHCTFCGLNGQSMTYRAMQPEAALRQFGSLFRYSSRVSRLDSVDNILPKNYFEEVLPFVETPPNVSMFYEVKADLSEEEVRRLAQARVKFIQPGIEALATSTLKLMRKGTSAFTNLLLLRHCSAYGITPGWNLLVGFPGEGEDVYRKYVEDLPRLTHLPPPSGVYPVRFDRYSPYFTQADKYGLDLKPLDFYGLIYPFDGGELQTLAYYFRDADADADYFQAMMKWLGRIRASVEAWVAAWGDPARTPPQLRLRADRPVVYDSRAGEPVEHEVGETGARILALLKRPRHLSDLSRELRHLPGFDAAAEVAKLQAKGLLFQEGDRLLSLVMDEAAPQPS
jgi:magnesium-protoporphyrin IX monomethyl ester (oxidative) cyclase